MEIINCESEWMDNHKQATIMSAQKQFQAVQSTTGLAVFFSIGTDDIFYITRQVDHSESGWEKIDASSTLAQYHDGKQVTAKQFQVARNAETKKLDLGLIVTVDGNDYFYLVQGHANTTDSWAGQVAWVAMPFDADNPPSPLVMDGLYLAETHNAEYIVVDVLKDPASTEKFIHRYYIDPSRNVTGKVWNRHDLSTDLNAGSITSTLGKKSQQRVDGIYTLGDINQKQELTYTPLYNPFNPALPPNPSRLDVPQDASAMATLAAKDNCTDLFVSAGGKLLYFPYDAQEDGACGVEVMDNPLLHDVKDLKAWSSDTDIVVWGLNRSGQIFYSRCAIGMQADSAAWSFPMPILTDVEQVATYLKDGGSSSNIFALRDGQDLIQLIQDPGTTHWQQRNIVLPSTDVDDVLEMRTYTTHVTITDDAHIPVTDQELLLSSTSPVNVYVDNVFKILSPDNPIAVATDATGSLSIVQETLGMGVVCYKLKQKETGQTIDVNPMTKLIDTISDVQSGSQLGDIEVTDADGKKQKLVPGSVSTADKDATAAALQKFVEVSGALPQNGGTQKATMLSAIDGQKFLDTADTFWGVSFDSDGSTFYEGRQGMEDFGLQLDASGTLALVRGEERFGDIGDAIKSAAGDVLSWLKHAFEDVESFFCQVLDGAWNFFVKIGKKLIRFVFQCISDVVGAVEFVFNKIKVFLNDLIKWLGFIFKWNDILRSHDVLFNVIRRYLEHGVDQIGDLRKELKTFFDNVEKHVDEWAGLEHDNTSIADRSKQSHKNVGQNSPQANYGVTHMKAGARGATSSSSVSPDFTKDIVDMLETLLQAIENEGEIFEKAATTIKDQIFGQLDSLSLGELVKRLAGVILDVLVESAENILDTVLALLAELVQGIVDLLTQPIDIPVLSWLYKKITGKQLSILDAACLVVAIPGTIVYKIAAEKAPFPDDAFTRSLIDATSWKELQDAFKNHDQALAASGGTALKYAFIGFMNYAASISSVAFIAVSVVKAGAEEAEIKALSEIQGVLFFTTTLPNMIAGLVSSDGKQSWYAVTGELIYLVSAAQKSADVFTYKPVMKPWITISKGVDCFLGFMAMIPAFASPIEKPGVRTVTNGLGAVAWNANRIVSPVADLKGSELQMALFAGKMIAIGVYGVVQFVLFVEALAEE